MDNMADQSEKEKNNSRQSTTYQKFVKGILLVHAVTTKLYNPM